MSTMNEQTRLAVITNRMQGIVRAMANTLFRTGRSGVLATGKDFSACIVTGDDQLLAAAESLPIHILAGPDLVARHMREHHPVLRAGDAFLHNSPYDGNSHAGDHCLLAPVVDDEGVHRFTVVVKAHLADVGNSEPSTYMALARDVYEEGALMFPSVQVQRDYEDVADVIRMCEARIRVPEMWRGDFLAMVGAARVGERELLALGAELGWEALADYGEEWFDYSERLMAARVGSLPARRVAASTAYDAMPVPGLEDGVPIGVIVEVRPDEGVVEIDCTANPDCVPCGINLTEATSRSAVLLGVFNSLGAGIPPNGGSFRRVRIKLGENCVCGIPAHPASCSTATTGVADRLASAVQMALSQLGDGVGMAECGGTLPAASSVVSGRDARNGDAAFINMLILGVTGGPGHAWGDGWLLHTGGCAGMILRDSTEMEELLYPVRIEVDRIEPDTEGAGRHRGAPSCHVELSPTHGPLELRWVGEGSTHAALGVRGGLEGANARQLKRRADGSVDPLEPFAGTRLEPGETLMSYSAGGGGFGPPLERTPERVAHDVVEGYVSLERAARSYGVVVTAAGALDPAATAALRDCGGL
ncbi:MAG: hydantoinase B/oxoprolinase family protein [Actinobacteria bacterium]|nr:hydantoinase B/oxoprolinase family protein [Actinomycetota bacterium]